MNIHCIIYFYDEKSLYYHQISDFCTKVNMCFLECNTIELMSYLVRNVKPMFVVFDNKTMSEKLINDFAQTNKRCIVYVLNNNEIKNTNSNVYIVDDIKKLEMLLTNHIHCYSNVSTMSPKDEKVCYELVHNELNKLSFRSKLIGAKYLSDLIYEILTSSSIFNGRCSNLYPKIALKYNTNSSSIERAMRFSIQKAYTASQNKNLFYEISKCNKAPTVKELTNYILDQIVLQMNKRQIC